MEAGGPRPGRPERGRSTRGCTGPVDASLLDLGEAGLERCIDVVLDAIGEGPGLDGAGCLLLDDHASLRYMSASDAAGRDIELAEELTAEARAPTPSCRASR